MCGWFFIEQIHVPISSIRIIDQHERNILSFFLVETALLHLAIMRIVYLIVAITVPDASFFPVLDTSVGY